jgi:hypothetical protein
MVEHEDNQLRYPEFLPADEVSTMSPQERAEWERQEYQARRNVNKFWQDLNRGRHYDRGENDNMDATVLDQTNYANGWLNALHGGNAPGRRVYDDQEATNRELGTRHYFYNTYDKDNYPKIFCRAPGQPKPHTQPTSQYRF